MESWDPALAADTVAREWWLIRLLDDPDVEVGALSDAVLAPPLYSHAHAEGYGTVFIAAYDPGASTVTYRWPGHDWPLSLVGFQEAEYTPVFPLPPPILV